MRCYDTSPFTSCFVNVYQSHRPAIPSELKQQCSQNGRRRIISVQLNQADSAPSSIVRSQCNEQRQLDDAEADNRAATCLNCFKVCQAIATSTISIRPSSCGPPITAVTMQPRGSLAAHPVCMRFVYTTPDPSQRGSAAGSTDCSITVATMQDSVADRCRSVSQCLVNPQKRNCAYSGQNDLQSTVSQIIFRKKLHQFRLKSDKVLNGIYITR